MPATGWDRLGVLVWGIGAGFVLWTVAGVLLLIAAIRSWKGYSRWGLTAEAGALWIAVVLAVVLISFWPTTNRMIAAAGAGDKARVALGLAYGIDINAQEERGHEFGPTALTHAIANQRGPIVIYLLNRGADINRVDGIGQTPLETAAMHFNAEMVKRLLEHGAQLRFDAEGRPLPAVKIEEVLHDYADYPEYVDPVKGQQVLKVLEDAARKQKQAISPSSKK